MSESLAIGPADVLAFWRDAGSQRWYTKDPDFDNQIAKRFLAVHEQASAGKLDHWAETAEGSLGLLILLDQFSRNMFRGSAQAFAQDEQAREVARNALRAGFDHAVEPELRAFFYLPFMHSEAIADQERCVALCHGSPDPGNLPYARDHERIVRRFGRFPHRNESLGRHTTPAERDFLVNGGFAG